MKGFEGEGMRGWKPNKNNLETGDYLFLSITIYCYSLLFVAIVRFVLARIKFYFSQSGYEYSH